MYGRRGPIVLLAMAVSALLLSLAANSTADVDLWGNIRFGRLILASGTLPESDPAVFTSDVPWINHEWLSGVVMAAAYDAAGVPGLLLLTGGAVLAMLALAARHLVRWGVGEAATVGLLAVLFAGVGSQLSNIRPQAFSGVMFCGLLAVIGWAERGNPRRLLWLLPLFALWANFHGGWIVGAGVLALWGFLATVRRRLRLLWGAGGPLLALAGSALTPYGWRLWVFLWTTVGLGRSDIDDWQPMWAHPSRLMPWGLAALVVVLAWRRRRPEQLHLFVPVTLLGLMALKVVRLDLSFVVAAVFLLGPAFAGTGPRRVQFTRPSSRAEVLVVGLILAAGLSAALLAGMRTASCLPVEGRRPVMPEAEALLFAQQNRLSGRMLTWYDYGNYATWYLVPPLTVSYDSRRETIFSDRVQAAHMRFYRGDAPEYPLALGAEFVWVPRWIPPVAQLPSHGWTPIFQGARSVIFARGTGAYAPVSPFTGPRCFPGP